MAEWMVELVIGLLAYNGAANTGVFIRLGAIIATQRDHARRLVKLERVTP